MRRAIPVLALLGLAALAVWAFLPRPVEVETAEVAPRSFEVHVEEEGQARIREVFTVSATIGGRLRRIDLHAGDPVAAGETVVAVIGPAAPVLLDSRARAVAKAAAAAAQAATDLARAQLAQAEAAREFADAEAARALGLLQRGATSQRTYDTAVLEQRTARAAVASALATLGVREQELQSALAVLRTDANGGDGACCENIVAPASGVVLRVLTESEQVVQPGTPILEIGDPAGMEVVVDVLSRDTVRIAPGAPAEVTGWGGPPIPARVERIEPSARTKVSALGIDEQRVEVVLALEGDPAARRSLGHGFRVIARIGLWQGRDVLSVPVGALLRNGSDWAVFAVEGGRARLRTITIGERGTELAQVLSGLEAGERVILHPGDAVADGVAVRRRPEP